MSNSQFANCKIIAPPKQLLTQPYFFQHK